MFFIAKTGRALIKAPLKCIMASQLHEQTVLLLAYILMTILVCPSNVHTQTSGLPSHPSALLSQLQDTCASHSVMHIPNQHYSYQKCEVHDHQLLHGFLPSIGEGRTVHTQTGCSSTQPQNLTPLLTKQKKCLSSN